MQSSWDDRIASAMEACRDGCSCNGSPASATAVTRWLEQRNNFAPAKTTSSRSTERKNSALLDWGVHSRGRQNSQPTCRPRVPGKGKECWINEEACVSEGPFGQFQQFQRKFKHFQFFVWLPKYSEKKPDQPSSIRRWIIFLEHHKSIISFRELS